MPTRSWPLHLEDHPGMATTFAGEQLTARCTEAFPPGKPIALRLALDAGELSLQARVIGSKQLPDGGFEVRLRLTSLRRRAREALAAAFA